MTVSGIEHDLEKSPYIVECEYSNGQTMVLYFSSTTGQNKFKREYEINRRDLNRSLSERFKMKFILADIFCDVILYRKCEARGFLVRIDGKKVKEWQGKLVYDGQKVTSND